MLFRLLRLLGLDVPAKIEAAKAELEFRVDRATVQAKHVAREAALAAAFSAAALVFVGMAIVVGLIALYLWISSVYGPFVGLGVVGGVLVVVALIAGVVAAGSARSLSLPAKDLPERPPRQVQSGPVVLRPVPVAPVTDFTSYQSMAPEPPVASASDLIEPLAFLASKYFKFPTLGNPVLDDAIGHLRSAARGSADEAIGRAANIVRYGSGANQAAVLAGVAFLGWLMTHHARQQSTSP
jgi:hypothetical protein